MTYTREEIQKLSRCGTTLADDAVTHDYLPRLLRESKLHGEKRIALYDCDGSLAIDDSGRVVWEYSMPHEAWRKCINRLERLWIYEPLAVNPTNAETRQLDIWRGGARKN